MSAQIDQELNTLIQCIATSFGDEVGQAVNEKIAAVLQIEGVDIANIQAQLATLSSLLADNTSGDATAVQNILSALSTLGARVDTLEGSTAVASLQATVAALQAQLAAETQSRQDADGSAAAALSTLQTQVDSLSNTLVTIQGSIGQNQNACDCAALTASIAELSTAVTNLQASDASTATQVQALQDSIVTLTTQAAGIAAAQATADAAASTAQAALAAAGAAQSTATAAAAAAAAAQATADGAASSASANQADIEAVKAAIRGVNCVVVGATFRGALRGRMGLALGQSN